VAAAFGIAATMAFLGWPGSNRPGPVASHGAGLAWTPGARQAYQLRIVSHVRLDTGAGTAAVEQVLTGTLQLRVLSVDRGTVELALQLDPARLELSGRRDGEMDRQLGTLFLATFDASGAPREFRFPRSLPRRVQDLLSEAVRTFQVVIPRGAGPEWQVDEAHATGRYAAAYRRLRDGSLRKTKLAYLETPGISVDVRKAEATIRLDPSASWIAGMVVTEEVVVSLERSPLSRSSMEAEISRVSPPEGSSLAIDAERRSSAEISAAFAAAPRPPRDEADAAAPVPRLAGEALRAALRGHVARLSQEGRTSVRAIYELRDFLRAHPEAAALVPGMLGSPGLESATAAALVNALGMAGTPEAQAALAEVAQDPAMGPVNRSRAIVAMGDVRDIEDSSLEALWRVARQSRHEPGVALPSTAALALGTVGSHLKVSQPARYEALRADLVRHLESARDPGDARAALLALGNTEDEALSGVVETWLEHESPAARAGAAQALGRLGSGGVQDRLATRLASEQAGQVRAAISTSLNRLPPPAPQTLELVTRLVRQEPDAEARFAMVRLLADNLEAFPPARAVLFDLSSQDPSKRIRVYASGRLFSAAR